MVQCTRRIVITSRAVFPSELSMVLVSCFVLTDVMHAPRLYSLRDRQSCMSLHHNLRLVQRHRWSRYVAPVLAMAERLLGPQIASRLPSEPSAVRGGEEGARAESDRCVGRCVGCCRFAQRPDLISCLSAIWGRCFCFC